MRLSLHASRGLRRSVPDVSVASRRGTPKYRVENAGQLWRRVANTLICEEESLQTAGAPHARRRRAARARSLPPAPARAPPRPPAPRSRRWIDDAAIPKKRWIDCVKDDMDAKDVACELTSDRNVWKEKTCCTNPK
ncbi:unnamed protein product [Chrysodeixis includens]|uniref:Uncharacterized protein n=1 Tax=Chrysodeixis includens TaxID=689277 RepID=A0A9N8L371_CHRIL|nr:unnamed protein product [Chrysodeixis includens]